MRSILISDFDGTLCRQDFYQLVIAHLLPANVPNYWQDYLDQKLTHFEVLRNYFAEIRCSEQAMEDILIRMELQPDLPALLERLRSASWEVVIASAGCAWYIHKLLRHVDKLPAIHANPGQFVEGQGLLMSLPYGAPFFSPINGIDKIAIVKAAITQVGQDNVAYAGDGLTDIVPALLVNEHHRYARGVLAQHLTAKKQRFHPFDHWAEIVEGLLEK